MQLVIWVHNTRHARVAWGHETGRPTARAVRAMLLRPCACQHPTLHFARAQGPDADAGGGEMKVEEADA